MRLRSVSYCAFGAWALLSCGSADEPAAAPAPPAPPSVPARPEIVEPARTDVRLSPDGTRLAFLAPAGGVPGLWLASTSDPAAARLVEPEAHAQIDAQIDAQTDAQIDAQIDAQTDSPTAPSGSRAAGAVLEAAWTYSGGRLLYVAESGEARVPRIFSVDGAETTSRALTPADRAARLVHLSPIRPTEAVVQLEGEDPAFGDLYLLDLESGDLELLAANHRFTGWGVDDDLDLRLAFEDAGDGVLVSQRAETGGWVDFSWVPAERAGTMRFLGFDGGAEVAYFVDGRGRDRAALVGAYVISGRADVLFQDAAADVTEVLFHPVLRTPQAAAANGKRQRWLVLDEAVRADLARLAELGDGALEVVDRTLDDSRWLVALVPWDAPRRFYLYDREAGTTELLFGGGGELIAAAGEDEEAPVTRVSSP